MTIVVAGATGTTGGAVLHALARAGAEPRAMTRSPEAAADLRAAGFDAVVADLTDAQTLSAAFDGATAAYLAQPASPQLPAHERGFAQAAADAGAHVVKLAALGTAPDSPSGLCRMHAESQAAIRAGGASWTFLQANGFMQNTLLVAGQLGSGVVRVPVPDARWSIIDARDVGAVAAAVLSDPAAHAGATHELTGPEPCSAREQVAVLSELLGAPLSVEELPIEAVVGGLSPWHRDRVRELYALYATGAAEAITPTVADLTGKPARNYRTFAGDHLEAIRP